MRLRPVRDVHQVMLAKLAWRLLRTPQSFWARILRSNYGQLGIESGSKIQSESLIWRGIIHGYALLKEGLEYTMEGGTRDVV